MKLTFLLSMLVASSWIGSVADAVDNTEKLLVGKSAPLNEPGFCIASDGAVWACRGDFGLERFDGEAWHDTNTFKRGGQDGRVGPVRPEADAGPPLDPPPTLNRMPAA